MTTILNNNFEFKVKGIYRDSGVNYLKDHMNTMKAVILQLSIYGPNADSNFYANLNEKKMLILGFLA